MCSLILRWPYQQTELNIQLKIICWSVKWVLLQVTGSALLEREQSENLSRLGAAKLLYKAADFRSFLFFSAHQQTLFLLCFTQATPLRQVASFVCLGSYGGASIFAFLGEHFCFRFSFETRLSFSTNSKSLSGAVKLSEFSHGLVCLGQLNPIADLHVCKARWIWIHLGLRKRIFHHSRARVLHRLMILRFCESAEWCFWQAYVWVHADHFFTEARGKKL